jgi:hypothetical protein
MKTTAIGRAPACAIAAALALIAAVNSAAPVRGPTNGRASQYCAPVEETADTIRFYCLNQRGWEPDGTTPAVANWT